VSITAGTPRPSWSSPTGVTVFCRTSRRSARTRHRPRTSRRTVSGSNYARNQPWISIPGPPARKRLPLFKRWIQAAAHSGRPELDSGQNFPKMATSAYHGRLSPLCQSEAKTPAIPRSPPGSATSKRRLAEPTRFTRSMATGRPSGQPSPTWAVIANLT
jgi:hypothetical protein